jgi:GTP cyclohydrolase I
MAKITWNEQGQRLVDGKLALEHSDEPQRCPACSFQPTNRNDFCEKHRPEERRAKMKSVEHAVSELLESLGYNNGAEALRGTPARVAAFYKIFANPQPFDFTTFTNDGSDEMIVQRNIPFYSLCEHHMLPFFGTAVVGYIPNGRIVGLSKLARCVQHCAAGLMNQEKITKAIANQIESALSPMGVGVVLRARHMCMEMRGVRAPGTETVTSCLVGTMKDGTTRSEFLELARAQ